MNAKELTSLNATELSRLATEKRAVLRDLRFKVATRALAKVHEVNVVKRDLARIEAELRSRATSSV